MDESPAAFTAEAWRAVQVVEVHGSFNAEEARRLVADIAPAAAREGVLVDLSHAASIGDSALGVLAGLMETSGEHVRVRGLGHHHERILEYLGAQPGALHADAADSFESRL